MSAETEAAGLADEFPGWEAWRGVDRLWHARVRGAVPAVMVHGEDPDDLRDQIIRYERLASYEREKQAIERARGSPHGTQAPEDPERSGGSPGAHATGQPRGGLPGARAPDRTESP